jgi:hypothetical protein
MENDLKCNFCKGQTTLTQLGIMRVYLFPSKFTLSLIVLGIAMSLFISKYWLILSAAACFIPLANADFRIYLYPFAAIGKLSGKEINCPNCATSGTIFK